MTIKINNRKIGPNEPPFIIAELSGNHNGSLDRALKTIDAAIECGADAIKLQTYTADTMTIDCERSDFIIKGGLWDGYKLYDLYKWAETPYEWHAALFDHARKRGITIFSTPFDDSAVDLLEKLNTPAYKIASFEILDLPLIRRVAKTNKPIIISTGLSSELEILDAVNAAKESGCTELILLHCISSYPAPINQANLRQIKELALRFNHYVGLSDHTMGIAVSVAAVALGACVIEKHFTLSRADKGPDSQFSLEPEEFKLLCRETNDAWLALGKSGFNRPESEANNLIFRRSLYFIRDLPAGHLIISEDIRCIRPGAGLAPKFIDDVIGRKLINDVKVGTPIKWELLS